MNIDDAKDFMRTTAKQQEIDKFSLKKGDVVITKDSETREDIGISSLIASEMPNTILGYHCALIRPRADVDGGFLNTYLKTTMSR